MLVKEKWFNLVLIKSSWHNFSTKPKKRIFNLDAVDGQINSMTEDKGMLNTVALLLLATLLVGGSFLAYRHYSGETQYELLI